MPIKKLPLFSFILLFACTARNQNSTPPEPSKSDVDIIKQALMAPYDAVNHDDMSDSLQFIHLKSLFNDRFVELPNGGEPLSDKETILEGLHGFFKTHKGHFDVTIDRLESSGDLAYALYHYHEVFNNISSGQKVVDMMHSALAVLRRDAEGKWKIEVWKYT